MTSKWSIVSLAVMTANLGACGGSGSSLTSTEYRVVASDGSSPSATEGEALHLSIVEVMGDGTTAALPSSATVTWSGPPTVNALPAGSTPAASVLPQPGATATSMWVRNQDHLTEAQTNGVLYILDKGTTPNPSVAVTATISGGAPAGTATAAIPVAAFPAGNAARGQTVYGDNCTACHGAHGEGTAIAPGLNNSVDAAGDPSVAADPSWTGALFAVAPLDNMDNQGVSLALSMPRWLITETKSGQFLTTQDFSDVYAFLRTQSVEGP
jgi:cytochrome c2